ncbi:MAG: ABC transporter ATP-binding protein [Desulfobacteraceae bacterium]|nr:MAG: ABC transporter ATP-binding protein [Desulfobacteraceae bacterium]
MVENELPPRSARMESQAPDDALLTAWGVSKSFLSSNTRLRVLNNLHLTLRRQETLAVVGASGIGKSTLLHILGTLDRPDSGRLYFQSEDVLQYSDLRLARFRNQTIGFVFQFHHLLPEFSALENTLMPALIQGMDKTQAAQMATEMLDRVGLSERRLHKATDLSGGEQQRVALARALVLRPPILLADEPTGNLDKKNSEQIHRMLLELNREMGMAMVVVTHNMELASLMSRQATISDGQLQYLDQLPSRDGK